MPPIIFILYPHMLASSVTLPLEMLQAAWAMAKAKNTKLAPLDVAFYSVDGSHINTHSGLALASTHLAPLPPHDHLVFLPALWRDPLKIVKQHPAIVAWLAQLDKRHSIAAVGTGVCFLAEAGRLDHQPATTHWHFFEKFERQYPKVHLKRGVFMTRSERLFCTASINALAELTALFIQEQYGERIAQEVERNFFHEIRQIRTQVSLNSPQATNDELVALATTALDDSINNSINNSANKNSGQHFSVQQLAASLGVSTRSLNRHFQQALQVSPLQYLQRKRMQLGEELLKTSNLSIADIASHIGLQDPEHFSRQFKKTYGIAPKQYRQTVRGKVFN